MLRDIVTLMKDTTLHCNEYLGALIKVEEIERKQRKNVQIWWSVVCRNLYIHYIRIDISNISIVKMFAIVSICFFYPKLFPLFSMISPIGVFDGVHFFVIPMTATRLKENNEKMISLLKTGAATALSKIDDDVTHVICNSADFSIAQKSVSDSAFCSFVTPKWVFISYSLHYCLPVVGCFQMVE